MNTVTPMHSSARALIPKLLLAAMSALFCAQVALATVGVAYQARMDVAEWRSDSGVLACRLVQEIPDFGLAVFERAAGGELVFTLQSSDTPLAAGQASLRAVAPRWHPQMDEAELGTVNVQAGTTPVRADAALATRMLSELYQGRALQLLRRAWYADEMAIEVGISPVTFRSAMGDYRRCLAQLAPVGFDELERSRIHFASDKSELLPASIAWLNTVSDYVLRADDVERLYIDGHTDNTHTTTYNVELSRQRAEAVANYLVARGVSRNLLAVRYHGERYPVKPNSSEAGKAYNRRVTLRIERVPRSLAAR